MRRPEGTWWVENIDRASATDRSPRRGGTAVTLECSTPRPKVASATNVSGVGRLTYAERRPPPTDRLGCAPRRTMASGQTVRHLILDQGIEGSNPSSPANPRLTPAHSGGPPLTMRAFTITAPGIGEVCEVASPTPGPGEAVVDVAYTGICGTDYRIFQGDFLSSFPLVNGHEFAGVVSAVGAGVDEWREGDRVAVDPTLYCGHCYHCLRRQANHCDHWGAIGDTRDGALAEQVVVPARHLYRGED